MTGSRLPEKFRVPLGSGESVAALAYAAAEPARAGITLLLGHGAGADQTSAFMVDFATALAARGIDTVTFNFPYAERGRRVPDGNERLEACFRSAIEAVRGRPGPGRGLLAIGGKSMGGRIASQLAAAGAGGLGGLVFLGYPLHPPGKPEQLRAAHLARIELPMLFLQGSRDPFGTPDELKPILDRLGLHARLEVIEGGDHSFKVPKRTRPQAEVYQAMQEQIEAWLRQLQQDKRLNLDSA